MGRSGTRVGRPSVKTETAHGPDGNFDRRAMARGLPGRSAPQYERQEGAQGEGGLMRFQSAAIRSDATAGKVCEEGD